MQRHDLTRQALVRATTNAGAEIYYNGKCLLCDALHKDPVFQFPPLSDEMIRRIWAEHAHNPPDVVFFSHGHPDHCSPELAREAAQRWPKAVFIAPLCVCDRQITLDHPQETHTVNGIQMTFIKTAHMPLAVPEGPHYACLADMGGFTVLLPGDTDLSDPALHELLLNRHVDLALMDFPWWMFPRGRRTLEALIKPGHLFLHHFPAPEHDKDHLYHITAARVEQYQGPMDIRILREPFQEESLSLPAGSDTAGFQD